MAWTLEQEAIEKEAFELLLNRYRKWKQWCEQEGLSPNEQLLFIKWASAISRLDWPEFQKPKDVI